nr:MAG TPA: hypothetical protein [Bacteriophage sp.]
MELSYFQLNMKLLYRHIYQYHPKSIQNQQYHH